MTADTVEGADIQSHGGLRIALYDIDWDMERCIFGQLNLLAKR